MRVLVLALLVAGFAALAGCHLIDGSSEKESAPPPPTFSQYHLEKWKWDDVARVLVLPVLNESAYTNAGVEVRTALTAELQRLGRFEIVAGPPDDRAVLAACVHRTGRFDEAVMIELGRNANVDVVIAGTVTHYSPYPRPRLGLILQAVGPKEAKVVASIDGMWDTTDFAVADRVRAYYRKKPHERPAWIRNNIIASDDSFAGELALDSPALFQRFVCHEAALVLLGLPLPETATDHKHGKTKGQRHEHSAKGSGRSVGSDAKCPPTPPVK
jgi:hypothetical protein